MVDLLKGMPGWGVGIAVYEEAYILSLRHENDGEGENVPGLRDGQ